MKILTTLLDIAATFLRLLESEGRMLKRAVVNVGWALAFIGVAALLVLVAAGFFLAGIYQYLAANISPAAASLLVSFPALVLAAIFATLVKWWTDDPK
jgi:ABC-type antimicrobial peptide transport system permease subunit